MDKISELLQYVHRTNPEMTREKLIEELSKSDYAARSLIFTKENFPLAPKIFRNFFVPPWGSVLGRDSIFTDFQKRVTNVQLSATFRK
jgi:hypothetical protein